jgi:hypothetical protein
MWLHNALFVIQKEKYMIKSLMIILILTVSLSHCSSTDYINLGAAVFSGMEDKPNPVGAVKMIMKKDKKDE